MLGKKISDGGGVSEKGRKREKKMNRRYEKVLSLLEAVVLLTGMIEWSLNWNK